MRIRTFVVATSAVAALLFLGGSYWAVSRAFDEAVQIKARDSATAVARVTFRAMYELMSTGWSREQATRFLQSIREANRESAVTVEIFRGPKVVDRFGEIEQPPFDGALLAGLDGGAPAARQDGQWFRLIYPVTAEERCLRCHANARVGDVLGLIEVRQDIARVLAQARAAFLRVAGLLVPAGMLLALLAVWWMNRRIEASLHAVESGVASVNAVSDLARLELRTSEEPRFAEFARLESALQGLVARLRDVAVDKDMLKFEIRLLERFVITSEVIRNWQGHVNALVVEINQVMPTRLLFSIFQVEDQVFDIEVFWYRSPDEALRASTEARIRAEFAHNASLAPAVTFTVHHHVAAPHEAMDGQGEALAPCLRMKSFAIDQPAIRGVVGIGVDDGVMQDATRQLVVDSVLSTLLNVICSVKAIYKYTRDLEYYATRDPLTDLFNQRVFWELLRYEISRAARHEQHFGLLIIDLDNFKLINDNYGHAVGDAYLEAFAKAARQALRTGDVLARYGGDEFAVILPEADLEQVSFVAGRLLDATRGIVLAAENGDAIRGTASIGIAIYPDHAREPKDLFLFADNMMYKAKAAGKERVAMPSAEDVMEVFRDLSQKGVMLLSAIDERRVRPFFQPMLSVRQREVVGYEVLSRVEVDGRLLRAEEFIEIAEKIGAIHRLDALVIETALATLREAGHQGSIFINLSPRALVLSEFATTVRRIVAASGVSPQQIVFEITERDTVKNLGLLERFLNDLKFDGYQLAIDDFGSGFSSFHYLRRFPVDFLKVEGDFIANMLHSAKDRAFVHSMCALAHQLGIRVVAEFVESEEVLAEVGRLGIDLAQGFYIGRPAHAPLSGAWRPAESGVLLPAEGPAYSQ